MCDASRKFYICGKHNNRGRLKVLIEIFLYYHLARSRNQFDVSKFQIPTSAALFNIYALFVENRRNFHLCDGCCFHNLLIRFSTFEGKIYFHIVFKLSPLALIIHKLLCMGNAAENCLASLSKRLRWGKSFSCFNLVFPDAEKNAFRSVFRGRGNEINKIYDTKTTLKINLLLFQR